MLYCSRTATCPPSSLNSVLSYAPCTAVLWAFSQP